MGKFEKIVVLLAFFLVSVILVVTFTGPEDELQKLTMEDLADLDGGDPDGAPAEGGAFARDQDNSGDNPRSRVGEGRGPAAAELSSEPEVKFPVSPEGEPVSPPPVAGLMERADQDRERDILLDDAFTRRETPAGELPERSVLITLKGLSSTFSESIMAYQWQRGDTWVALAERLYGDANKSGLLRQFNEGSTYVAPGTEVLIPVFDGREAGGAVADRDAPREELSEERGTLYRVIDGDSLWVISKKVYGKGHLWEKIYKANMDLLKSPEAVKPGMGLRIP